MDKFQNRALLKTLGKSL